MKRIFIIRHGKTQWNLEKRLQGAHGDSPLLLTDQTPYAQLAGYLDQYTYAAAYTSPLARAQTTAKLICRRLHQSPGLQLQTVSDLTELCFGQWEGQTRQSLMAKQPEQFQKLSQRIYTPVLKQLGVENFHQARQRFAAALTQIAFELPPDSNALVFSHGGISQLGIQGLTGNPRLLGLKNLATSIVAVGQDGFYLEVYNQTAYLDHVNLNEGNVSI